MVYSAERSARNAENDRTNGVGMCLQQVRLWSDIPARYPDATTAWRNTNDRHPGNRKPPRGSDVYWTGGSRGHGHIAKSLGNGKIRTTDVPSGRCATVDLGYIERNWHLTYAGWSWDTNEVTIPHGKAPAKKAPPKKAAPKPRTNILNAIKDVDKAIKSNKDDKDLVKELERHKAALEKLSKK